MSAKSKPALDPTPDEWAALFEAAGGRLAVARVLDVAESTVYRWSRDQVPVPKTAKIAIDALCKQHKVEPIFNVTTKE